MGKVKVTSAGNLLVNIGMDEKCKPLAVLLTKSKGRDESVYYKISLTKLICNGSSFSREFLSGEYLNEAEVEGIIHVLTELKAKKV